MKRVGVCVALVAVMMGISSCGKRGPLEPRPQPIAQVQR